MTQDEDLGILRSGGSREQDEPAEHPGRRSDTAGEATQHTIIPDPTRRR
jgi:hypothetical protein